MGINVNYVVSLLQRAVVVQALVVTKLGDGERGEFGPHDEEIRLLEQLTYVASLLDEGAAEFIDGPTWEFATIEWLWSCEMEGAPKWLDEISNYWLHDGALTEANVARLKVFIADTHDNLAALAKVRMPDRWAREHPNSPEGLAYIDRASGMADTAAELDG